MPDAYVVPEDETLRVEDNNCYESSLIRHRYV